MTTAKEQRILGVLTSRPEFDPPWQQLESLSTMQLSGLSQVESRKLVESVFTHHRVSENLKQNLIHNSDGVPLFLEESCYSVIGQIDSSPNKMPSSDRYQLPETLQDSLNSRLDQLGEAKVLAQLASACGESFSYQLINYLAELNGIDADLYIDTLIDQNILLLEQQNVDDQFKFRHFMFQEAAYQSLLKKSRQIFHRQIAQWLQSTDYNIVKRTPEILAYHFSKTDQISQAINLWSRAGRLAIEKSAFAESIDHLTNGIRLLEKLEQRSERANRELELLLDLGVALTARSGYYGFEVTRTYERAANLASQIGNDAQEWTALYGLWRCFISQAEYAKGIKVTTKLAALCHELNQPILNLSVSGIRAMTRLVDGKLMKADKLSDTAVALYSQVEDKYVGQRFGQDPFVTIQGLGSVAKLLRGRICASVIAINRSVEVARQIGHPYTIAETLKLAAMYEHLSRNTDQLRQYCVEAIEISDQYGFDGVLATTRIFLGFADLTKDRNPSHIETIRENLINYEQHYGLLFLPYFQSILAESYLLCHRYSEAYDSAETILRDVEQSGENWVMPTVLHVKAMAAIKGKLASPQQSSEWYEAALRTAKIQDARLILGRILLNHEYFNLADSILRDYRRIADHAEDSAQLANHDYISVRH